MQVGMEYNTDLFLPETMERMAGHYITLLEGIVANPDAPVAQLPMLTTAERELLLVGWNETAVASYPDSQCIHELFEAQVQKTPTATAVVSGDQSLSYAELNQRANQVAHYLKNNHRIEPNQFIGLCVTRKCGDAHRLTGHPQSRGSLPADGSRLSGRTLSVYARRHTSEHHPDAVPTASTTTGNRRQHHLFRYRLDKASAKKAQKIQAAMFSHKT